MATFLGRSAPGFGFFIIGLWHLINHIKLHALHPNSYKSSPWFPTSKIKYLELYFLMFVCSMIISTELFIGPHHHPLGPDGAIPSTHLRNFEHTNIALTFFTYASFSILLDKLAPPAQYGLTNLLHAAAYGHAFLILRLHSTDHTGLEGQYHWPLHILTFTSFVTALLGISYPMSFVNSFVRSVSILFLGVWFLVLGFLLWIPGLIPKGCFSTLEEGHKVVQCRGEEARERAKALANIQFSWCFIGMIIFAMTLYLGMTKFYSEKVEYRSLSRLYVVEDHENGYDDDVEAQKKANNV